MRRRAFITFLGSAAAVRLSAARAQQAGAMRRIGVLTGSSESPQVRSNITAFIRSMQNLGWRDDQNIRIDVRWLSPADPQRLQNETADLIARKPEVIVSGTSVAIAQVLRISSTPIVFAGITDPVSQGFVKSLARADSTATGFAA
jgi:putative ABC transport system substrate-binding protein